MYQRILDAVDGSETARHAFDAARESLPSHPTDRANFIGKVRALPAPLFKAIALAAR